MKCLVATAIFLLMTPTLALAAPTCLARSHDLFTALKSGQYAAATAHFDSPMKNAVSTDTLKQIWESQLPLLLGSYDPVAHGQVTRTSSDGATVTPLHFANGWLDMKVACSDTMEVSGLRFLPGQPPSGVAPVRRKTVLGDWGVSTPTQVASPLGPLPATLTLPQGKGPFAAAVLVGGSGPHDRDESIGPNKPFRDIARGLAARGVASLRYDKRTFAYREKMAADPALTIDEEATADALTAARQLAKMAGIDPRRVFVLGHSLGAMMAPRIAQRDRELAGLVMLAAPARPLLEVSAQQVREQSQRKGLTPTQIAASEQAISAERDLLSTSDPHHPPKGMFGGVPQSYWLSLHDYDQVTVARGLTMPMLFLQGGDDFQVSPKNDFGRWQQALKNKTAVRFHRYPGLNHLFMPAGKSETPADYNIPGHVDAQVIADIAQWIKAQPAR